MPRVVFHGLPSMSPKRRRSWKPGFDAFGTVTSVKYTKNTVTVVYKALSEQSKTALTHDSGRIKLGKIKCRVTIHDDKTVSKPHTSKPRHRERWQDPEEGQYEPLQTLTGCYPAHCMHWNPMTSSWDFDEWDPGAWETDSYYDDYYYGNYYSDFDDDCSSFYEPSHVLESNWASCY